MNNFNDFKIAFRTTVLASSTVSSLIDTRFFGADIASLKDNDASFPMATFTHLPGPEYLVLQSFDINIKAYSDDNFDESHDVFDAIKEELRCTTVAPNTVIHSLTSPSEMYDEIGRLYTVMGKFHVSRILSR